MEPNIWGSGAWTFLHSVTLNYPDNPTITIKKKYLDFFNILPEILPCNICKLNLKKHIKKYPIRFYLNSKETLSKWLVNIHNLTNIDNNKSTISYEQFLKIYKKKYSTVYHYKSIFLILCIIIVIILIYKNYKLFNFHPNI